MSSRLLALALALAAPAASALDVLPSHVRLGDEEARVLVRLPEGGRLVVDAAPPVLVALAEPEDGAPGAWRPTPATFEVEARAHNDSWHGLPGTVDVVARRADAQQEVTLTLRDWSGAGTEVAWPAAAPQASREAPGAGAAAVVTVIIAVAALTAGRAGGARP